MTPKEARLLLSDREWQVAKLDHKGKPIKEIAAELGLSVGTVKRYIWSAKKKLGKNYRNYNLFWHGESLSSNLLRNGNSKSNGWDKKCGKELLEWEIKTGRASMAFKKYAQGDIYLSGEVRLAYAINGLGERDYLYKKRAETIKDLSSARYYVVKLNKSMLSSAVKDVISNLKLQLIKTDLPGLEKGDSATYTYLCRTYKEYNILISAIVGLPDIEYDNDFRKVVIRYNQPVYVNHIRVKQFIAGEFKIVAYGKYMLRGKVFEVAAELKPEASYVINIQIGNEAQLDYNFKP